MQPSIRTNLSPSEFVKMFAPSLQEYLEQTYSNDGHVEDLLLAASEFFGVSYYATGTVLRELGYTKPTATKRKSTKQ